LSRACLGKKIAFTYKWLQDAGSARQSVGSMPASNDRVAYQSLRENASFVSTYPTFVPSLSW
jgi:hypothetical protein